jgi:cysteinyl-tRNA synthetase
MGLSLYNTLNRKKEALEPIEPGHVRMYVCGPTVYSLAHIGNARPVVVFDVLMRVLRHHYPRVTYVRNITDIDDKIIAAAAKRGEPIAELTQRTEDAFHQDMAALGAEAPDVEPHATDYIADMIRSIEALIGNGHAYVDEGGHVLFDVPSFPGYGSLSRQSRDDLIAGARVEVASYKKDAADFVLWKPSEAEQPGWDSPWGRGRPGWHIECSVMSEILLGVPFDIHGGGRDLIFPHHENEIAQSVCSHAVSPNGGGADFARMWVHNGYLTVNDEKMAKSQGNIVTVRELMRDWHGETIRLAILSTHYRQPLDWTEASLVRAKQNLDRLYSALRHAGGVEACAKARLPDEIEAALDDDLNTPLALSHLHALSSELNKADDPSTRARLKGEIMLASSLLGILQEDPLAWFRWQPADAVGVDVEVVERMISDRINARERRDFTEADRIREQLLSEYEVVLEDGPEGTTWRLAG